MSVCVRRIATTRTTPGTSTPVATSTTTTPATRIGQPRLFKQKNNKVYAQRRLFEEMNKEPKSLALCLNNTARDVRDFRMKPVSTITRQKTKDK